MAININQVVTKGGDGGKTSLGGGKRVFKNDIVIDVLGCLDETNATIGLLVALMENEIEKTAFFEEEVQWLLGIQSLLFDIGGEISLLGQGAAVSLLKAAYAEQLEERIQQHLFYQKPLKTFVLPGGSLPAAYAHVIRTVIRRAERVFVGLAREHEDRLDPNILVILNRLSDYFFVLARAFNAHGQTDRLWKPARPL